MTPGKTWGAALLAIAAFALGYWLGSADVDEPATTALDRQDADAEQDATSPQAESRTRTHAPKQGSTTTDRSTEERRESLPDDTWNSAALRRHGVTGLREGWASKRDDEMPDPLLERGLARFLDSVRTQPQGIGRSLAAAETKLETAAKYGEVFRLLQDLENGGTTKSKELVADRGRFEQLFETASKQHVVVGKVDMMRPDEQLEDGSVLSFGRGVFRLRSLMRYKSPFPRDVTIRGAGMDATLIIHDGDLTTRRRPLINFAVEDCTFYASNYLTDLRSVPASIRLTRVRVCGFDIGAGGSVAFAADQLALHAIDCRFEGGYGRHPSSGNLMRSSSRGSVARFDNCVFRLLHIGYAGTLHFDRCRFEQVFADPRRRRARTEFRECSFDLLDSRKAPRLDLAKLFPGFAKHR